MATAIAWGVIGVLVAVPAHAGEMRSERYLDAVVDAWRTDPVYVDPSQHLLMPGADAALIDERVRAQGPSVHIAVVPAVALAGMSGGTDDERGAAFVEEAAGRLGTDGHYFVVFGGTGTYGGSVGAGPLADAVLLSQLDSFTRGQPAALLHAVLDGLGLPPLPDAEGEESSGTSPLPFVVIAMAVVAVVAGGLLWWRARQSSGNRPALYRPSFTAMPGELDSLAGRRAMAREDVTRLGEEISIADLPVDDLAVAADVQAAMDAYGQVSTAVDDEPDDLVLRAIQSTSEYGRWRLACAHARVAGRPLPPRRADCFFDARHGISVSDWTYTPANGVRRDVPVCAGCRDARAGAGR